MHPEERQLVLDQLALSHARLVNLISGLTPAQWAFREAPGRWTIAENIEHLVLFERFILSAVTAALNRPAESREDISEKQSLVLGLAAARHIKFQAREAVHPTGRWPSPDALLSELQLARQQTLAFASTTSAGLHRHFFAHIAWGDLDCFQWLLLLSQHSLRHAFQIEEVMAISAYPAHAPGGQ